ncbi:MAG: VWA domain-containing protein [Chloroflexi bacterium]|nr:VWA domain-containing protein [Chloroflexota bacterium]
MKGKRWFVLLLVGLFFVGVSFFPVHAQEIPEEPDDVIQVILVLDVSSSMEEPILTDDLPDELFALYDQLDAAHENDELLQIQQAIDDILVDPEIVDARAAYLETVDALDAWFAENQYAQNQAFIMQQARQALLDLDCNPIYDQPIATALTIDEIDYWIAQACSGVTINYENQQDLRDLVPYVGETEYTSLQENSDAAYKIYFDALETRNYNALIDQRDAKRLDLNIDALAADVDTMIAELGIPRKLDLAKLAAKTLIDLSRLDSAAGRRDSTLGLVRFSTDSVLLRGLTADHDIVERKIDALESLEMTNIYDGLDETLRELERNADPDKPIVILLLSDGHITVGPGPDEVIRDIPPRANAMDAVICTVGIGPTEAHVDYELLASLAYETEGEYLFAKSGDELVNFFVACRQGMVGEIAQMIGYIGANASEAVEPQTVPENTCEFSLALNSTSGIPILEILDPDGNRIDDAYGNFSFQSGDNLKLYTVLHPAAGEWNIAVTSDASVDEETFFSIVVTTNQCAQTPAPVFSPTPYLTQTPLPGPSFVEQAAPVLPLVILVLVVMGIFIVITLRRK